MAWRAGPRQDRQCAYGRRYSVSRLAPGGDQRGTADPRGVLARYREVARRGQAAAKGGRSRGAQLRIVEPERRPTLQICRDLADRRMEQNRAPCRTACGTDRPVV